MTVHRHLHLTESADQALLWWMEEFYRPYAGEYVWTDGAALAGYRAGRTSTAPATPCYRA